MQFLVSSTSLPSGRTGKIKSTFSSSKTRHRNAANLSISQATQSFVEGCETDRDLTEMGGTSGPPGHLWKWAGHKPQERRRCWEKTKLSILLRIGLSFCKARYLWQGWKTLARRADLLFGNSKEKRQQLMASHLNKTHDFSGATVRLPYTWSPW